MAVCIISTKRPIVHPKIRKKMAQFIKVTAYQVGQDGRKLPQQIAIDIDLNTDLIGAFKGQEVLIKGSSIISLNGLLYSHLRLASGQKIPTL